MPRLDAYLRNTGLIKQRAQAKQACDAGRVRVDGRLARPSHELHPGARIALDLPDRVVELEVRAVPPRPVARRCRDQYYRLVREDPRDPFADLEF